MSSGDDSPLSSGGMLSSFRRIFGGKPDKASAPEDEAGAATQDEDADVAESGVVTPSAAKDSLVLDEPAELILGDATHEAPAPDDENDALVLGPHMRAAPAVEGPVGDDPADEEAKDDVSVYETGAANPDGGKDQDPTETTAVENTAYVEDGAGDVEDGDGIVGNKETAGGATWVVTEDMAENAADIPEAAETDDAGMGLDDDDEVGDIVPNEDEDQLTRLSSKELAGLSHLTGGLFAKAVFDARNKTGDDAGDEAGDEAWDDGAEESPLDEPTAPEEPDEDAGDAPEPAEGADAQELEETIRRIVREELAGEMGQQLSKNIQRMIREQVVEAMLRRE